VKTTLAAALLGFVACSAHAGAIGAYGGKMSTADFGDATAVGVKLEAALIESLCLEIRGGYAFDFDADELLLDEFRMYSGEAGLLLRIPFGEYFSLHAGAGGGYYVMPEFDMMMPDGVVRSSDIGDAPGAYGLAGVELGAPSFRIFAEAKYLFLQPETVEAEFLQDRYTEIDTDLSGVTLQAGVVLRW
jgi:hypothetical protein